MKNSKNWDLMVCQNERKPTCYKISIQPCLDSKKLTDEKRVKLASIIEANLDWVGWAVYVISPQDISTNMLQR
jgi:ribonuclease HII